MKHKEQEAAEYAPSAELVRKVHEQRGRSVSLRRIDGAQLLPLRRALGRRPRRAWQLGAALGVAGLLALLLVRSATRPLSFTVEGGRLGSGGLVEASAGEAKMRFSDGTEVALDPGTRAVVRRVDGHGARVALASGKAHVDVTHRPEARWLFDAGPFLITVTGTAFNLGWTEADQRLDVQMERGSVEVRGPLSDGALAIRSGQHLIVRVRERETIIRDLEDTPAAAPAPIASSEPAAIESPPARGVVVRDRPAATMPASPSAASADCKQPGSDWSALLASGDSEAILRQAERCGINRCLTTCSGADLATLADAARYRRRDDVARRTLLAERHRFPTSASAKDAAFLLGRLEETGDRSPAAIEWFDSYLVESPFGTYASEALGRKMVLVQRARGDSDARPIAVQYLARFPEGAYAARARALIQTP